MHQLDIGGVLPNNVYFGNENISLFVISIYDNKLSSNLPKYLINTNKTKPVVLTGNLFTIYNKNDIPKWMIHSNFTDANQLYLDNMSILKNWIITIIAFGCYLFVVINTCSKWKFIKDTDNEFVENIKGIEQKLTDWKLLMIILALLIFYPFSCSYYQDFPILSYFSLFFYENENIYNQICLVLFVILYNGITIFIVTNIITKPIHINYWLSIKGNNVMVRNMSLAKDLMVNKQIPRMQSFEIDDSAIIDNDSDETENESLISMIAWFILYLILHILSIIILCLYIVSESLPSDNIIGIGHITQNILSYSIYLVVAINTAIITPRFIDSMFKLFSLPFKCELNINQMVMISRTITTIIIPLISSFVLLNNCGNSWKYLWNPCLNNVESFEISHPLVPSSTPFNYTFCSNGIYNKWCHGTNTFGFSPMELKILTHEQVCSPFSDVNWNKCLRSFLFKWCNVLMLKMIIMFFMPVFIMISKIIKTKCKNRLKNQEKKK
eukprot:438219_1